MTTLQVITVALQRVSPRVAIGLALTLGLAGCGGSAGATKPNSQSNSSTTASKSTNIIRFALSPDPVWDYLNSSGIRQKMEQKTGFRVIDSSSWDEFGIYASGNVDIVSAATFEVPGLVAATKTPSVIFGKYNIDRAVLLTKSGNPAKTLKDLKGQKIAVFSTESSTLLWRAYAKKYEGLDLRPNGGDFKLVLSDPQQEAGLVTRGDVAACICLPDFAIEPLRTGKLKIMYGGRPVTYLLAPKLWPNGHEGPMINDFVATKAFAQKNPKALAFFLDLWQKGVDAWWKNERAIISSYPDDFAIQNKSLDVPWMVSYLNKRQWFVKSVAMTPKWVADEKKIFPLLKETGVMAKSQPVPEFVTVQPSAARAPRSS